MTVAATKNPRLEAIKLIFGDNLDEITLPDVLK
jgi:hypothetical protein